MGGPVGQHSLATLCSELKHTDPLGACVMVQQVQQLCAMLASYIGALV